MVVHDSAFNGPSPLPLPLVLVLALVVIIVDLRVAKYFLDDLYLPERRVAGGDKSVWAAVILFGSVLGMMAYILVGREN